ncbi:MAG TPA: protein-glutamate O-methyltransferase CheR [Candidatus Acidoferrales bacterium]|nr:protein-glutamate O-methyltransferase CheR [Candidatus Acidoferrales bacterium]
MKPVIDAGEPDTVRPLAPQEFEQIRQLAYSTFGLDLKSGKEELVSARLRRLVLNGGYRCFDEYYRSIVADKTGAGLAAMIDALATNHTAFLREPDHFVFLRDRVLPRLAHRDLIEIWSAACSTGEEVWTLAMVVRDALPSARLRINGSDISQKALAFAQRAVFPLDRCQGLPAAWLARYFEPEGRPAHAHRVSPALRALAAFRSVNLVKSFSWGRQFPVIFCRNVMIYFDRPTQEQVIRHLADCLEPGGYLFVGHAESLTRVSHSLEYVQPAVYRKPQRKEGPWNKSS